tara:strand:+ start:593 stop:826 length:234 start_codon:yes stop_codon:yes gene_type:complete
MNISHEERLELLKAHNDLKSMLMTIHECNDLWISDVGKLETLECILHRVFKFVPQEDDEGRPQYYKDFVLAELDDED